MISFLFLRHGDDLLLILYVHGMHKTFEQLIIISFVLLLCDCYICIAVACLMHAGIIQ